MLTSFVSVAVHGVICSLAESKTGFAQLGIGGAVCTCSGRGKAEVGENRRPSMQSGLESGG